MEPPKTKWELAEQGELEAPRAMRKVVQFWVIFCGSFEVVFIYFCLFVVVKHAVHSTFPGFRNPWGVGILGR